jgi:hypothetical protein
MRIAAPAEQTDVTGRNRRPAMNLPMDKPSSAKSFYHNDSVGFAPSAPNGGNAPLSHVGVRHVTYVIRQCPTCSQNAQIP